MPGSLKERRALSTVRSGGPMVAHGAQGGRLRAALAAAADDEAVRALTHRFHTYPARLHPAVAGKLIDLTSGEQKRRLTVLDPFCGSGTVLVEAQRRRALALGVDANPLAVLVARARTWLPGDAKLATFRDRAQEIAAEVISAGKAARRRTGRPPRPAPGTVTPDPLAHWFAPHVWREVTALRTAIASEMDERMRDQLTAVLSSVLYKVSWRESDTSTEKVERDIARGASARWFQRRAEELADGLTELAVCGAPPPRIVRGDARRLDVADGSVDVIVTSPPYAGTYDYLEHHELRMNFFGMGAGRFKASEIGARRKFSGDASRAMSAWERDMRKVLSEMVRVLKPGGSAAVVIGDSVVARRAVYARDIMERITPRTFELAAWAGQERPTLGSVEARVFADEPKREWILLYQRR